jgi:CheY-like chemotaxis protein
VIESGNVAPQGEKEQYEVSCYSCKGRFDTLEAVWCNCLVSERTLVCPSCMTCFCRAPWGYKERFWASAPQLLWDKKIEEHSLNSSPRPNPEPEHVIRPLVMVVDDDREIQKMSHRVLEGLGYGVILARDGLEGLELAGKYKPDLILTDALMPRMDGREMCRQIKAGPETKEIKVVVMTSLYTQAKYKAEAFKEFKVDDYLSKPLDFNHLWNLLQKYLG